MRLLPAMLVILILGVGVSCTSKQIKIGFLVPNLIEDRYAQEKEFFNTKIRELGGEAIVLSGENSDEQQIKQAGELLAQGVQVLVVNSVNKVTAAAIVRKAHEKHVPVIAYERIISNCDPDYFISFDNIKVGELMARYALDKKPEGNYMLLCGDKSDQNALWVKEGFLNVLKASIDAKKVNIVYDTYIEVWSADEAEYQVGQYLKLSGKVPDVILSAYDGMSGGAIRALEAGHVGVLPLITGQNAEVDACKNIVEGKQTMTIYKAFKLESETAAAMAMDIAAGKSVDHTSRIGNGTIDVPAVLLDPVVVDSLNIREVLVKSNYLKEQDLYSMRGK